MMIVFNLLALHSILATGILLTTIMSAEGESSENSSANDGVQEKCTVNNKRKNFQNVANNNEPTTVDESKQLASLYTKPSTTSNRFLPYLQVDDIDSGLYDDPASVPENSCTRPCVRGDRRTCYYNFHLEPYVTLGGACGNCASNQTECGNVQCVAADGYQRSILTINRRMPAPSIQVCEGDNIVVDVHNMMGGRSTTIHWHGLLMKDSKFMDGVPQVTQCPIVEGSTFRYIFPTETWGTYFYHSHDALQKVDGLVGSFVIRPPKDEDPNKDEYDYDLPSHVVVIQDWKHVTAESIFPGFATGPFQEPDTFLINGRGQFIQENGTALVNTPLSEFNVIPGKRYVFRIIAGSCFQCQYILTIEKHDFLIIGTDGRPTQPYRVDSLTMSPGERYTVVVSAIRAVDSYWMMVKTVVDCVKMKAYQLAVLRYEGGPETPSTVRPNYSESDANKVGLTMSPLNSLCTEETRVQDGPCLHDLRHAFQPISDDITKRQPDLRIYWVWTFYDFNLTSLYQKGKYFKYFQGVDDILAGTVNGIVNNIPPSPLLSQPKDVPSKVVCSSDIANLTTWKTTHRECTHVINLPVNKVVEIVSIHNATYNPEGFSHSIHLHGYDMYVIEMGLMNQNVSKDDAIYELMDYLDSDERREVPSHPVNKDTFPLTNAGYTVARIYTENIGYWFFHCHFVYHMESGMSGILQVGEVHTFPLPPAGFPRCGEYVPEC